MSRGTAGRARGDEQRALLSVVAVSGVAFGLTAMLTSVVAVQTGASPALAGIAVAAMQVPVLLLDVVGTRWTPRLEVRRTVVLSLLVFAAGSLVASSGTYPALVAGRVVQGVGAALLVGAAGYALVRGTGGGAGLGAFNAAWFTGIAAGPFLAGAMATRAGGLQGAFLLSAAVAALAALAARVLVRPAHSGLPPVLGLPAGVRVQGARARAALVGSAAGQSLRSGLAMTLLPLFGTQALHLAPGHLGLGLTFLAVTDVAAMAAGPWLGERLGRPVLLLAACVWGAGAVLLLVAAPGPRTFLLTCAALGVTVGVAWVLPGGVALDLVPGLESGFTAHRIACDVGLLAGALFAGVMVALDPGTALLLCLLPLLVLALLSLLVGEPRRLPASAAAPVLPLSVPTEEVLS